MTPEDELEDVLSQPPEPLAADLAALDGEVVILGASGKMGPTLVKLLVRGDRAAGVTRRVVAVARFAEGLPQPASGVEYLAADLLDPNQVRALPTAANVLYLVGHKFGTTADPARTWAINTAVPALVADRYRDARLVVFSTGNVYPPSAPSGGGPTESDLTGPVGDYAQSALAREHLFRFYAARHRTPLAILRINYAIEPRYGVLREIGDRVFAGLPVDLSMGWVNVIWQRDANAVAIRALRQAAVPPVTFNLTGAIVSVRSIAEGFGRRLGRQVTFTGIEDDLALLSNPARCVEAFGPLPVTLDEMLDRVAAWIAAGGVSLGKPTHFAERAGRF
ncbi:MAG: NAD(P)-dependent oxidoreductase [Gemmatimonadetes bacterium]|nr:NAD(P)-dependent oxidoreductase [Gemmatimonadota bacterium]